MDNVQGLSGWSLGKFGNYLRKVIKDIITFPCVELLHEQKRTS